MSSAARFFFNKGGSAEVRIFAGQSGLRPVLHFTPGAKQGIRFPMKKALHVCGLLALVLLVLGAAGVAGVYIWAARDLPEITRLGDYKPPLATTVLARDGSLIGLLYNEKRFMVSLQDVPKELPRAFLAIEDAGFYEHEGVDPKAVVRAFIANLQSGGISQGASTITQQVIKRLLLTPERKYERKIKEAILAYRLERYLTKDEILTIYLNQTFLGANAYGVEAAARTYFGKHAKDLTLAECALIAGLPQAPSRYNPYRDPAAAKNRQMTVLRRMREIRWITEAEYDAAAGQPLVYHAMAENMGWEGAWYLEEVRRRLIDMLSEENAKKAGITLPFYGEQAVYELGLTVRTAMEPRAQSAADKALRNGLEVTGKRHGWQGPLEKIPADQVLHRLAETRFSPGALLNGAWTKAVVVKVTEKEAEVRLGPYAGVIPVKNMSWARTPNPNIVAAYAPAVKDARKVLEAGDVVWVSASETIDPKTKKPIPYDPQSVTDDTVIPLRLEQYPEVQGALVSVEPGSGDVVAMVGGYSFAASQFNRATQAHRQPGSSFKPIVYSAALDNGFTPASVILDAPVVYTDPYTGKMWRPGNFEKNFNGPMLLRTALALSRNLCTIRVAQQMGIAAVVERAKALGLEPDFPEALSISLGAVAVSPLNMAQAYTAFANGGMVSTPRFILSIHDDQGKPVYQAAPELREAVSPQNAFLMAALLKDVVNAGTANRAKVLGRPLGGKTGTSNDEKDAWFLGITPSLVTAVYVGYDQVKPMGRQETGGHVALPIFVDYAKIALEAYPPDDFPVPPGITFARVDGQTGAPAGPDSTKILTLPFYAGTEPGRETEESRSAEAAKRGEDLLKQLF